MTYSSQFIKLTWMWKILGTDEIANTSLNFTSSPGWAGATAQLTQLNAGTRLNNIVNIMQILVNGLGAADYSALTGVKAAAVGTDGHYLVDPISWEYSGPVAGTLNNVPPQVTLCASLRTGFSIGGGNYGRMYIPHTLVAIGDATPYIPEAVVTNVNGLLKTFVEDVSEEVNTAGPSVLFPAVMSNKGAGTGKQIKFVGTGRVVDTQRRRRNRLDDTATLVALA